MILKPPYISHYFTHLLFEIVLPKVCDFVEIMDEIIKTWLLNYQFSFRLFIQSFFLKSTFIELSSLCNWSHKIDVFKSPRRAYYDRKKFKGETIKEDIDYKPTNSWGFPSFIFKMFSLYIHCSIQDSCLNKWNVEHIMINLLHYISLIGYFSKQWWRSKGNLWHQLYHLLL